MKSLEERIGELTQSIMDLAQADIDKIQSEAKHKEAEILKRGKVQARQLYDEIIEKTRHEAELRKEEKLAEITVKARVDAYERREELLTSVFSLVQERLQKAPSETGYSTALQGLIREAVIQVRTQKVLLRFDPESRKQIQQADLDALASELGITIEFGEDLTEGTGVLAMDEKGHRTFENTLERRLDRQIEKFRSEVFNLLIGESS